MHVSQVMSKEVVTADPEASVVEVARLMREHEVGSVVVEMDTPVGIITQSDVVGVVAEGLDASSLTAADVMSQDLVTVDGFEDVEVAVERMREENVDKLPVIYGGALVGIISTNDVTHQFSRIVEGEPVSEDELVEELNDLVG
ncbi:MAG: CBS domain-containing protein [Halobacteriota archaeon]